MSSYSHISVSYNLFDDIQQNYSVHFVKPKTTYLRWILLIIILVISILILIIIVPIKMRKTCSNKPKNVTCEFASIRTYERNGTIVAGVLSTSNDQLNKLRGPKSVYLDRDKNIYVADSGNHRIRKYVQHNSEQGQTLIDQTSNINYPQGLFIEQQTNSLFFIDQDIEGNYRVQLIRLDFNPLKSTILIVGNQSKSYGMHFDDHRNIYISEYNHHRIVKWFSPSYDQYKVIVHNGLNYPRSIYFDQRTNSLFVADANRIQRFSLNSTESQIVTQGGSQCPNGIQLDCHGNLYFSQDTTIKLINQNTPLHGVDIIPTQLYTQWVLYPPTKYECYLLLKVH